MSGSDVDALWQRFRARRRDADRNAIVSHYAHLVRRIALEFSRPLPLNVDTPELISAGTEGLCRAIANFDPDRFRGMQFEVYAGPRIRGAMWDYLRTLSPNTRSGASFARQQELAIAALVQAHGEFPTDVEVAEQMGITVDQYRDRCTRHLAASPVMFSVLDGSPAESHRDGATYVADGVAAPEPREESFDAFLVLVSRLPSRERIVLYMVYCGGLTLAQTGALIGVTESRVSQIHKQALRELREHWEHRRDDRAA